MFELQIAGLVLMVLLLAALSIASMLRGADSRYSDTLKYERRTNW